MTKRKRAEISGRDAVRNARREHGINHGYYDNLGDGWRLECLCGWETDPHDNIASAGHDFDIHLESVGAAKVKP